MKVQKVQEIKVVEDWVSPDGKYALHKGEQATYLPEIKEPGTYRIVLDVGVMARIPKYYFESPIEYIDNATPEMLARDWEELKSFNEFGQDTVEHLQDQYDKNREIYTCCPRLSFKCKYSIFPWKNQKYLQKNQEKLDFFSITYYL